MNLDELIQVIDRVKLYRSQVAKLQEEIDAQEGYKSNATLAVFKLNITLTAVQQELTAALSDLRALFSS